VNCPLEREWEREREYFKPIFFVRTGRKQVELSQLSELRPRSCGDDNCFVGARPSTVASQPVLQWPGMLPSHRSDVHRAPRISPIPVATSSAVKGVAKRSSRAKTLVHELGAVSAWYGPDGATEFSVDVHVLRLESESMRVRTVHLCAFVGNMVQLFLCHNDD
jgi:hypothetical protein